MIAATLDAVLILVVMEAVALALHHRRTGRGVAPRHLFPNLAAGFCLTLVARLCAAGGGAPPASRVTLAAVGAVLFAALLAHLLDLAVRWRA